ncbi:MAG: hypothetical protein QOF10_1963 [Kribbellaceae bacterium]|nr:hypothetical protein [Kribbellaceae bacterium]
MSTTVRATGDPAEFKATVFPFLQRDPVLNSVILTNTEDRIRGILHDSAPPVFLSVHDDPGEVVGAVMCTPHRGIYLGAFPDALVPAIVGPAAELAPNRDVVEGTATAAGLFADLFSVRRSPAVTIPPGSLRGSTSADGRATFRQARGTRLHKLIHFVEQTAHGSARLAVADDLELATQLLGAYGAELGDSLPPFEEKRWVEARIKLGRLWLWENDGRVVSLVGHQSAVFGATRVGPVYTPAADRGHGYASALTAYVTQRILASGSEACLYTDLANPTSNKIYAAIGYEPVADFLAYEFN